MSFALQKWTQVLTNYINIWLDKALSRQIKINVFERYLLFETPGHHLSK